MSTGRASAARDRAIEALDGLLAEARGPGAGTGARGAASAYLNLLTRSLNLVRNTCGENSEHYRALQRLADSQRTATNGYFYPHCRAILAAARADFAEGLLFDLRTLIHAELLGDIVEQARTLLSSGYHVAAASLAGAALEDALRQVCVSNQIPLPGRPSLNTLNVELAKAGVYNQIVAKRILGLAQIRNDADHGNIAAVKAPDVEDFVSYVIRFTADYLS
jgi:hypothetical protein